MPEIDDTFPYMKKVAIVFYGLTRNLRATFPSLKKNIFRCLSRQGIEFDVYLHTYFLETLTNFRSGEDHVPLDNDEWKMLYPLRYLVDVQDEVDKVLPHEEFCRLQNPWPETDPTRNSMRNLLRQLYSLKRAWSMLESRPRYDGYLVLRPDLHYMPSVQFRFALPVPEREIYLPDWGGTGNGVNDRICLTSYEGARVVMNRLDHVMEYGRTRAPHSQMFLHFILESNGFQQRLLCLFARRVRAGVPQKKESVEEWYAQAQQDFATKTSAAFWTTDCNVFHT